MRESERERERERECVCVCERERERERECTLVIAHKPGRKSDLQGSEWSLTPHLWSCEEPGL